MYCGEDYTDDYYRDRQLARLKQEREADDLAAAQQRRLARRAAFEFCGRGPCCLQDGHEGACR